MNDRYFQSFSIDDKESYLQHFHEFGFVVVDNVLSSDECSASVGEVWNYLRERGVMPGETETWENNLWPKEICRNGGFVGRFPFFLKMKQSNLEERGISTQVQAWKNRLNPLIYNIFSEILGTKKLWVSVDRYGIMRPTVIHLSNEREETKPEEAGKKFMLGIGEGRMENQTQLVALGSIPFPFWDISCGFYSKFRNFL
eukprot:TRINITY_DN4362_c0_g1_i5.p1 TRINITY_DN4362_c0_g1~~TRINITY_DN4362_c0_g1_i5.p1  ORF type:complete len:199 (-),score=45.71 TRINITY_DN4362_c0_g1_i5:613-1209(-)